MRKMIEFPSGLKLVYVPNSAVRSVATGVFVNAGTEHELPDEAGISHFIEHMLFKGTTNRTAYQIAYETDCIGANLNAYTSKSHTCYYTTSLDNHVEKCVDVLADMYLNPLFAKEDLDNERKVVYEEINEGEDTPDDVCLENLLNERYSGNPLGKPILGYKKTLRKMTSQDLKDYMRRQYTPQNTVVSFAGNISEEECVRLVDKYFESHLKPTDKVDRIHDHKDADCKFVSQKKKITQAHVAMAFPSYPHGDDRCNYVSLMNSIFASDMSGRLFQSIREKLGLCYTIAGYPSVYENNGVYVIYTSTSPENAVLATKAIKEQILLLLKDGISDEELAKSKEQLKTALVLGQESTSAMMRAFGRYAVQSGELYDTDHVLDVIDGATKQDVMAAAEYVFNFDSVTVSLVSADVDTDLLAEIR